MSESQNAGRFQMTEPALLANPSFDEPRRYKDPRTKKESGDPKYSSRVVLDPKGSDFPALKALAASAAKAKFPGVPFKDLAFPFRNGDEMIAKKKADLAKENKTYNGNLDYLAGKVVMTCRSKFPPAMAAIVNGRMTDIPAENKVLINQNFFTGAEVLGVLNVSAYDEVGTNKAGVTVYLNEVFATGKGKRIGGTRSAASTFAGYAGKPSGEDPTAGSEAGDDEIPF